MNTNNNNKLCNNLSSRHIQMIALGGSIGTGIFYASAKCINNVGPAISLAYFISGIAIFIIMRALGEMIVDKPVLGSFSQYSSEYLGDFAGFFTGWNYWFTYIIVGMIELTAAGKLVHFWVPDLEQWKTALAFLILVTIINLFNVKMFAEFEFWLSIIKVVTIFAFIVFGLIYILLNADSSSSVGIENLWIHGGFSPNGIPSLFSSLVIVMFAFNGIEHLGIAASETKNPKKTLPKAINQVIGKILFLYLASILVIIIITPWNMIDPSKSPFVQLFSYLGIPSAASLINFVVITAVVSSYISGLYSNGRTLLSLSQQGNAPKIFKKLSKNNIPSIGILATSTITLCGIVLNYLYPDKVLPCLISVSLISTLNNWTIILITHLQYRKSKTPNQLKLLSFKLPLCPYSNYFCIGFLALVGSIIPLNEDFYIAVYFAPFLYGTIYLGYKAKFSFFRFFSTYKS